MSLEVSIYIWLASLSSSLLVRMMLERLGAIGLANQGDKLQPIGCDSFTSKPS